MKNINLFNKLTSYGLHDTEITKITITKNIITFFFNDGVYNLNEVGQETEKTLPVYLNVYVNFFVGENIDNHSELIIYSKRKQKYCDVSKFAEQFSNQYMDINNVFFSDFSNAILIKGNYKNCGYELYVEDICDIEYCFLPK